MKHLMKRFTSLTLALLLMLTLFVSFNACKETTETEAPSLLPSGDVTDAPTDNVLPDIWKDALYQEDVTLGEGAKTLQVEFEAEKHSITVTLKTDKDILGDALLELGLVAGEQGAYGLYIKKANGITADYDIDQTYWAFYQNGEYMMTGVDTTTIKGGEHFELVRTK